MTQQQTIAKSVVAGTGALVTGITTAVADGAMNVWELVVLILTALGSAAAVWATTNEPAKPTQ